MLKTWAHRDALSKKNSSYKLTRMGGPQYRIKFYAFKHRAHYYNQLIKSD